MPSAACIARPDRKSGSLLQQLNYFFRRRCLSRDFVSVGDDR